MSDGASSSHTAAVASLETLDVIEHQYGFSVLSDVTLIAATEASTHHYRVHRQVLVPHSNWFRLILVGDLSATMVALPDTICQQLPELEWLLTEWNASAVRYILRA